MYRSSAAAGRRARRQVRDPRRPRAHHRPRRGPRSRRLGLRRRRPPHRSGRVLELGLLPRRSSAPTSGSCRRRPSPPRPRAGPATARSSTTARRAASRPRKAWKKSRAGRQGYFRGYLTTTPKAKADAARFKLNVPSTGNYTVYARWPASKTNSNSVPVSIATTTGTQLAHVNERHHGGKWRKLGVYALPRRRHLVGALLALDEGQGHRRRRRGQDRRRALAAARVRCRPWRRTSSRRVEIPKGCSNKYEWDEELGAIKLDRMLFSSLGYPTDYGFFRDTLAADGDPLDVMIVVSEPTFPGCLIEVKPVALFRMRDENAEDNKILCVPHFGSQLEPHRAPRGPPRDAARRDLALLLDLQDARVEGRQGRRLVPARGGARVDRARPQAVPREGLGAPCRSGSGGVSRSFAPALVVARALHLDQPLGAVQLPGRAQAALVAARRARACPAPSPARSAARP